MAAIIALAADNVHIAPNGLFLLHNASGSVWGNAQDFRATADDLDKYDTSLISSIVGKTGLTEDQVREKWFDYKDHLFTAQQALDNKLVDSITNDKAELPEDISNWDMKKVQDFFSNDKDPIDSQNSFFDMIYKRVLTALNSNTETKQKKDTMKELKKVADHFGVTVEEMSVENLINAIEDKYTANLTEITDERNTAVSDLATANATITANTALVNGLGEEVANATDFAGKIVAVKTKLAAKPGSGPTIVDDVTDTIPDESADLEKAIGNLSHNKIADDL
jgi:ribosomal protein L12E/L44/L45/RPP1/RPP2